MNTDKQSLEALLRQACSNAGEVAPVEMPVAVAKEFARLVRVAAAAECEEIALRHHQVDGAYAAGKKAGALECVGALSAASCIHRKAP